MAVEDLQEDILIHLSAHRLIFIAWLTLAVALTSPRSPAAQGVSDQADELVRTRVEAAGTPPRITVARELIHASVALPLFYERRGYRLVWSGENGPLPLADTLILSLHEADAEGLRPSDYHLTKVRSIIQDLRQGWGSNDPGRLHKLVDLDLLLTDAFLVYGSHLLVGRVNPETIDPEWVANRRQADLAEILGRTVRTGRVAESLRNLLPPQPGYGRLKQALAECRKIDSIGGWPKVPHGPKLQKGDRGPRVAALRDRLAASGGMVPEQGDTAELFDDGLEEAVRRFQRRHGLQDDGVVGPASLAALNVTAEERARQIEINLERWRWLPQDLGEAYVLVNIANFELDVVKEDHPLMTMRAIVGKDYRRTPVFSDKITYLVLSPYWHVPPKLAVQDVLPQAHKDPNYLVSQKIRVYLGWGGDSKEINPKDIDWSKVTARNFAYRFRQDPGPKNALGRVKFMFPNKFDVYLHDTPSPELFGKAERTFSSGCIRIEKPIDLAEYLLRDDPKWRREEILAAIGRGVEQTVQLPHPVPIHLLYWTAWADEDGSVYFRKDIYDRDRLLDEALRERPPFVAENQREAGR
ncbi:MAG: L,D-transpeptidase family protein [Candidatus Zixiibacteriota bacterium]